MLQNAGKLSYPVFNKNGCDIQLDQRFMQVGMLDLVDAINSLNPPQNLTKFEVLLSRVHERADGFIVIEGTVQIEEDERSIKVIPEASGAFTATVNPRAVKKSLPEISLAGQIRDTIPGSATCLAHLFNHSASELRNKVRVK